MASGTAAMPAKALPGLPDTILRTFLNPGAALWNWYEQISKAGPAPAVHAPPSVRSPQQQGRSTPGTNQDEICVRLHNMPPGACVSTSAHGAVVHVDTGKGGVKTHPGTASGTGSPHSPAFSDAAKPSPLAAMSQAGAAGARAALWDALHPKSDVCKAPAFTPASGWYNPVIASQPAPPKAAHDGSPNWSGLLGEPIQVPFDGKAPADPHAKHPNGAAAPKAGPHHDASAQTNDLFGPGGPSQVGAGVSAVVPKIDFGLLGEPKKAPSDSQVLADSIAKSDAAMKAFDAQMSQTLRPFQPDQNCVPQQSPNRNDASDDPIVREFLDQISRGEHTTDADAQTAPHPRRGHKPRRTFASGYDVTYDYGHYDTSTVPLTSMTLDQVDQVQQEIHGNTVKAGKPTSAVGKYQFERGTLLGLRKILKLSPDTPFTPELQDRMATYLLKNDGGLNRYKKGQLSADKFEDRLNNLWASIQKHDGTVAKGQFSGTTRAQIQAIIQKVPVVPEKEKPPVAHHRKKKKTPVTPQKK